MVGDVHGKGSVWWGAYIVGGACVAGETATAADGTHPTGIHSFAVCISTVDNKCIGFLYLAQTNFTRFQNVRVHVFCNVLFLTIKLKSPGPMDLFHMGYNRHLSSSPEDQWFCLRWLQH